eukprot:Tbor_TRINITY_DN3568_c0_g1::TRINITY_DN3568_c0_g1_i1::g.2960::m.2960/K14753/RACK1; guanine nucleotide-binding protein subunit beta-2-like 1 protein
MSLVYSGVLKGHSGWVTSLVCPQATDSSTKVLSASRDKTLVSWKAAENRTSVEDDYGVPEKRLEGHSDFVSDVAISNNGDFAVSASWDRSLRLWNLKSGETICKFLGHTKDALSVAFSPDNRQIVSGARDGKMKMWNVKGENMTTAEAHDDWVSCVRFSPSSSNPVIVSGSWDNTVKVWSSTFQCLHTLKGHTGHVNSVTISPDGSLCASAGKDGKAKLWDLARGEHLYELNCEEPVNQICFSPNRYWLCAATESCVRVYDLEDKSLVASLTPEVAEGVKAKPQCVTIAWSADGSVLYSGYTDNVIRVWTVRDSDM